MRVLARELEREHLAPVEAFELTKKEVFVEQGRRQRFRKVRGVVRPLVKVGRVRRIRCGLRRDWMRRELRVLLRVLLLLQ